MSTQRDSTRVTEQERLLFLKLKMALAVAIIKSKPQGTSVREFSQKLASNLRNSNEIWKKRAEDLEREVLRLRQELLLTRAQGEEPEEHTESEVLEVFSQDLFAPIKDTDQLVESDSETPDLLLDVHTNTYVLPSTCTNTTATTATITATATSAAPAAALSRDSAFTRPAFFSHTQDALPHVQFIQTLCSLQHFASPQSDPLCLGLAPEGGPVLEESMSQLLHSIWAVFRASAPSRAGAPGSSGQTSGALYPSHSALLRACEVLTSALEVYCLHWNPSVELSVSVEEVMGGLTQTLLHQEPQEQLRDSLADCLLSLSRSNLLKCFLIRQILSHLSTVTAHLWTLHQSSDPDLDSFPLVQYLNSCRLMWILEQLLQLPNPPITDHGSYRPIRDNMNTDNPIREEHDSSQPMNDDLIADRPIGNLNNPIREDNASNQPITDSQSSYQPMRIEFNSNGPMTEEFYSSQPVREDLNVGQPMTKDHSSNPPTREDPSLNRPMSRSTGSNGPIRVDLWSVRRVLSGLQQRVFPLSQEYPLFCVCLWRLLGLLSDRDNMEDRS